MFYLIEYIFLMIYFFVYIFNYMEKYIFYTDGGTKLEKYVNKEETNIAKLSKAISKKYKEILNIFIISFVVTLFRFSISYKFFNSNFIYINILNKNIDITNILGNKIIIFKVSYLIFLYFFVFKSIYFIHNFLISKRKNSVIPKKDSLYIGKDKSDNDIYLEKNGMYQNILITGSIGSGKTSSAITNILDYFIKNNIFGLIIDIKGNFIDIVRNVAKKYNKENLIINLNLYNDKKYNPLNNELNEIELASTLKKVLELNQSKNLSDPYWLDKAEEYFRHFIILIRSYKEYVDIGELHKLIVDKDYLESKLKLLKNNILENKYDNTFLFSLNNCLLTIKNEYLKLDDRTIGIIKSEMTRMTSIFVTNYEIYNKFCDNSEFINFYENKIFVLSVDISKNERLSRIISTYIKLDFQNQVLKNSKYKKDIFFICDEYEIIANSSDAQFFSLSREFKCINVVSMQSYSSLNSILQKEEISNVIFQNFVNKIWFRNDDVYTISKIIKQIGKTTSVLKSKNYSEISPSSKYNMISKSFKNYKSGIAESINYQERLQYLISEEYFSQMLNVYEAVCILSNGKSINLYEFAKLKRWEGENEF